MTTITTNTIIDAPVARVFDLARSIELHMITSKQLNEKAVAGRTSGLIHESETVTWQLQHCGIPLELTSLIKSMQAPFFFVDQQMRGPFKFFRHLHLFKEVKDKTIMHDCLQYTVPLKPVGLLFDRIYLIQFIQSYLNKRNQLIKFYAENDNKWMQLLNTY